MSTALVAAGASLRDVIAWIVFIHTGAEVRAANGAIAPGALPATARALVAAALVAGLGVPGALIEIAAVAALPPTP